MTGMEAYHTLRVVTASLPVHSVVAINPADAPDLMKLTAERLVRLKFEEKWADEIDRDLSHGSLRLLGRGMGLVLQIVRFCPRLRQVT